MIRYYILQDYFKERSINENPYDILVNIYRNAISFIMQNLFCIFLFANVLTFFRNMNIYM